MFFSKKKWIITLETPVNRRFGKSKSSFELESWERVCKGAAYVIPGVKEEELVLPDALIKDIKVMAKIRKDYETIKQKMDVKDEKGQEVDLKNCLFLLVSTDRTNVTGYPWNDINIEVLVRKIMAGDKPSYEVLAAGDKEFTGVIKNSRSGPLSSLLQFIGKGLGTKPGKPVCLAVHEGMPQEEAPLLYLVLPK